MRPRIRMPTRSRIRRSSRGTGVVVSRWSLVGQASGKLQDGFAPSQKFSRKVIHGLLVEDRTHGVFIRGFAAGEANGVGRRNKSGRGAESAGDEAGRGAGYLSHGR